jgi:hypothetical protein
MINSKNDNHFSTNTNNFIDKNNNTGMNLK